MLHHSIFYAQQVPSVGIISLVLLVKKVQDPPEHTASMWDHWDWFPQHLNSEVHTFHRIIRHFYFSHPNFDIQNECDIQKNVTLEMFFARHTLMVLDKLYHCVRVSPFPHTPPVITEYLLRWIKMTTS